MARRKFTNDSEVQEAIWGLVGCLDGVAEAIEGTEWAVLSIRVSGLRERPLLNLLREIADQVDLKIEGGA